MVQRSEAVTNATQKPANQQTSKPANQFRVESLGGIVGFALFLTSLATPARSVAAQSWDPTDNTACDQLGAGTSGDAFAFSGIFYGDLGSTTYQHPSAPSFISQGDNYTQMYPPINAPCLTVYKNNISCYGEFPWVFKDGVRMLFEGSRFTSETTINRCANLSSSGCQPNYDDEWLQNQIFTDFSQSTYPMTLVATAPLTNFNVFGTADCGTILYNQSLNTPDSSYCGVFVASSTFGGCSRMDIDEGSATVACANQTNHNESETTSINPLSRTMVISYYGTLFGQGAEAFEGIGAPAVGGAAGTGISFLP